MAQSRRSRRGRGESGLVATVVVLPVVVLAAWLSIQAALVMHARNVVRAAAEDAAVAGASGTADPHSVAAALVQRAAGDITSGLRIDVARGGGIVSVVVGARVVTVIPFGSFAVSESASAPVEEFIPEPERP